MREPLVAGQFYYADAERLRRQVRDCFTHEYGPGSTPGDNTYAVRGAIVPHAGIPFSGPCAAHAYKAIGESPAPTRIILLGPSHRGADTCLSAEPWRTPLGETEPDTDFIDRLSRDLEIPVDETAHAVEHSLEVQLPFLFTLYNQPPPLVPLLVSPDRDPIELGRQLADYTKDALVLVSSDFTHFGAQFGHVPFTSDIARNMHARDSEAIQHVLSADAEGFLSFVRKHDATICGTYPIATAIPVLKDMSTSFLSYYTSADLMGDYSHAVGYAAIVFRDN